MAARLDDRDRRYLQLAVELSRGFLHDERRWPFGAVVVVDDQIVGQGINRVVELHDATACGLRDLQLYAELLRPAGPRSMREDGGDGEPRQAAVAILQGWARRFQPQPDHEG